jgi:hypothetical protein
MYLYYFSHLVLVTLIFHGIIIIIIIIIIIKCRVLYVVCKFFVVSFYILMLTL